MHWFPAYIGLGSNLDEPAARVQEALAELLQWPDCCAVTASPLYGSKPLGPVAQPDFCNAVAGLLTRLSALDLLRALRALEQQLGRGPAREQWGPRRIDLDLLVYGTERMTTEELTVPHPAIVQRNFVLYPLSDVAPELVVPGLGRAADLKRSLNSDGLWRMDGKPMTVSA